MNSLIKFKGVKKKTSSETEACWSAILGNTKYDYVKSLFGETACDKNRFTQLSLLSFYLS